MLGRDSLAIDPRFATASDRQRNAEALDAALAELTREHEGAELEARL